jgi:hypothetical protein
VVRIAAASASETTGRMGAHIDGGKRRLPPLTPVRSRVRQ